MDQPETAGALSEQPASDNQYNLGAGEQPLQDESHATTDFDLDAAFAVLEGSVDPHDLPQENQTDAQKPAGEQPQDDDEELHPADASKAPQRLSVRFLPANEREQMAAALDMVRKGEAPTIADAFLAMVPRSQETPAEAPPIAQTVPDAVAQADPEVDAIEARIADLIAARDQAEDDFEIPEKRRLEGLIREEERALVRAQLLSEQRAQQAVSYRESYVANVDAMEAKYPDLADETTEFYQTLDDMVTAAEFRGDPILQDPSHILILADRAAARLGVKASVGYARNEPAKAPVRTSRPTGSAVAPGQSAAPRTTPEQLRQLVRDASPDELFAVLE
jgi:hypothetical protein